MKIYNTMSKKKEEFIPLEEGKVRMYVCGPTVYNFIHIGNARPMIVFDTVIFSYLSIIIQASVLQSHMQELRLPQMHSGNQYPLSSECLQQNHRFLLQDG